MTPIGTIIRDAWYQIGLLDRIQANHGSIEIYQVIAHRRMRVHRDKLLGQIDSVFHDANSKLTKMLDQSSCDMALLEKHENSLSHVQTLYDLAAKQPVWPFNFRILYSFLASVGTPSLLMVVQLFLNRVSETI